jgi:hypothetical protein
MENKTKTSAKSETKMAEVKITKDLKVKMVKFHQAVQIGNAPVTYLTPREYRSTPGGPDFSKVIRIPEGVEIHIQGLIIIVSWTNIAYLVLENPE